MKNSFAVAPTIQLAKSRFAMGRQSALAVADEIRALLSRQPGIRMIFAAAPSQCEMLSALRAEPGIDWSRVTAFHMDEYLDLPAGTPQSFATWLSNAIFDHLPFAAVHLIEPAASPEQTAAEYAEELQAAPIDIVCCGIGVNGHLAFNDPPANFDDPETVRIVYLDQQCRQQQVDDNCFASLSEVPERALTITVPGLLNSGSIFCTVPGALKKHAVRSSLLEPITPLCPASALRLHPRCHIFLDAESASLLSA